MRANHDKNRRPIGADERERGFTLIELLVVASILALIMSLSVPVLSGSYREAARRAAVRSLAARLGYAHRRAIGKSKNVRVVFDTSARASWIETEDSPGKYIKDRDTAGARMKLPDSITSIRVSSPGGDLSSSESFAEFHPDGTALPRKALLLSSGGSKYEITVHPAAGTVAVKQP